MSGDRYGVGLTQTAISGVAGDVGTDAVGELQGIAVKRGWVYDALFSQGGAAGDGTIRWEVNRATTSATGAAAVEVALDPGSGVALLLSEEEVTVGPTVTVDTQMLDFDLNQRASFRWVASPDGEIIVPATATEGILITASNQGAVYAGIARCTLHWEE